MSLSLEIPEGMPLRNRVAKRVLDLSIAVPGLILCSPLIALAWMAAAISTGHNGFFVQQRIGIGGHPFPLFKIRSMRVDPLLGTTVTTEGDRRITRVGAVLRKTKVDELPQLANVILGHMSLVGPRPDVSGFADRLEGEDRILLSLRPGITGPASLAFRDEERLLAENPNPEQYNRDVIWPQKVALNRQYMDDWSLMGDLRIIVQTVIGR